MDKIRMYINGQEITETQEFEIKRSWDLLEQIKNDIVADFRKRAESGKERQTIKGFIADFIRYAQRNGFGIVPIKLPRKAKKMFKKIYGHAPFMIIARGNNHDFLYYE